MRNRPNSFCHRIRSFCLAVLTLGTAAMLPAAIPGAAGTAATLLAGQVPAPDYQSRPERNVDGIMDNSFFVEEAYNQERGVVQHIFNALYSHFDLPGSDADIYQLAFTQEWPVFSQAHQFSYTVPYGFLDTDGGSDNGFQDMLLNYRYQAWFDPETLTAFAPRFSLVLPTGKEQLGFGYDTVGYQLNLPFSTAIGDYWFVHANAGMTFLPNVFSTSEDLINYNLGASAIYAATPNFHFMLEWIGNWTDLASRYEFQSLISPGIRHAFNFDGGSQLVVGVAAPIGLTSSTADVGVFLYLSFEHAFAKTD